MNDAVRFPFVASGSGRAGSVLMPLLPLEISLVGGQTVQVQGMLDTGATVNVLPFSLGLRLGAVWEDQKTVVKLTGNLAASEARALLVVATVANFAPLKLVFAWSKSDEIPLLLGQVNFFQEFDVCFHAGRREFEVTPSRK